MADKTIKGRLIQKHDVQSNWEKATNFVPLKGEIIIYDPDVNNENSRMKVGDGVHNVNELKFIESSKAEIANKATEADHATTADSATSADTLDGKHASDFALATDLNEVSELVGDTAVSEQIADAIAEVPSDVLIVTFGGNATNGFTADKTFEQIKEAYDNDKYIYALSSGIKLDLTNINASKAWFSGINLSGLLAYTLTITSENVVDFTSSSKSATQYAYGGVKAATKSDTDTVEAKIGTDGKLYVPTYPSLDGYATEEYTDTAIANLVNSAPETLDTLGEIATAMSENADVVEALEAAVGTKANASDLTAHTGNKSNPHGVTLAQLGVTATAAELNIMDGVTATTTELNYVDGVTSNIQAQLNGKAAASEVTALKSLVGDTAVATQISNAVAQKSAVQFITWGADD